MLLAAVLSFSSKATSSIQSRNFFVSGFYFQNLSTHLKFPVTNYKNTLAARSMQPRPEAGTTYNCACGKLSETI